MQHSHILLHYDVILFELISLSLELQRHSYFTLLTYYSRFSHAVFYGPCVSLLGSVCLCESN